MACFPTKACERGYRNGGVFTLSRASRAAPFFNRSDGSAMGATDQDFFDNLLSGLEASVFDADPFSSPVKPSQGSQYQRVPAVPLSTKAVNTFSTPKKKPAKYVKVDSHQKKPPSIANAAKDKENIAELLEGIDDWDDSAIDILKSPPTKILGASVAPPPTSQPLRLPISKQYLRFSIDHVQEGAHPASGQLCKVRLRSQT